MLEPALTAGFIGTGMDVVLVGPLPTPAIAHADAQPARRSRRDDLAPPTTPTRTTASSCSARTASSCRTREEAAIEALMDEPPRRPRLVAPAALGRASRLDDAQGRYIEAVKNTFPRGLTLGRAEDRRRLRPWRRLPVAPTVLWELGAEVVARRRRAGRLQHQPRLRRAPRPRMLAELGARAPAPTSASPSTATPTGDPGRRDGPAWSMATRSWR